MEIGYNQAEDVRNLLIKIILQIFLLSRTLQVLTG